MILAIAGRRAETARILVDATLADAVHEYTHDFAAADLVVVLDGSPDLSDVADDAVVVAYSDDPDVARSTTPLSARVITVGLSAAADVRADSIGSSIDGTTFVLAAGEHRAAVSVGILGESIVPLALAALAVSGAAGVPTADAIASLGAVRAAAPHDMQVTRWRDGTVVIVDAADGSALSTANALKALAELTIDGTRGVAVLGELDLPASTDAVESREEHDRIGRLVVRLNVSRLIVVGQKARHIHNAAGLEGSWDGESVLVDSADEAYDLLNDSEFESSGATPTVVLVKSGATGDLGALGDRIALINEHRTATA